MAVTQPGEDVFWTACLSMEFSNLEETQYLIGQVKLKKGLKEEDVSYVGIECRKGECEKSLVPVLESSVVVEPEGAQKGGSADGGLQGEHSVENITSNKLKLNWQKPPKVTTVWPQLGSWLLITQKALTGRMGWYFRLDLTDWETTWNSCVCLGLTGASV